jgi:hypothetical protein
MNLMQRLHLWMRENFLSGLEVEVHEVELCVA